MGSITDYVRNTAKVTQRALSDVWRRYSTLGWRGKAFIWFIIMIHVFIIGVFVRAGPKKVFQTMCVCRRASDSASMSKRSNTSRDRYDIAQDLRHMRFGWLILATVAGKYFTTEFQLDVSVLKRLSHSRHFLSPFAWVFHHDDDLWIRLRTLGWMGNSRA